MKTFAIANSKGGSGKSTTAVALAAASVKMGNRVLLLDMDSQGNASYFVKADANRPGTHALLMGTPATQLIQHTESGIDIISANWQLSTVQTAKGSGNRLAKALAIIEKQYDVCFIDLPPQLGQLQINGMMAADGLVIPLQSAIGDLQGLHQMSDVYRQIYQANKRIAPAGVIITRYKGNSNLSKHLHETITATASDYGFPWLATIPEGIAIQESQAVQQTIFDYAPHSKPAVAYMAAWNKLSEGK